MTGWHVCTYGYYNCTVPPAASSPSRNERNKHVNLHTIKSILNPTAPKSRFLNGNLHVVDVSDFNFFAPASLAMHIMGILVLLIGAFNAPTPPRSPADIPCTPSMMRHVRFVVVTPRALVFCCPSIHPSRLLMFIPSSTSFLLLVSLAFISIGLGTQMRRSSSAYSWGTGY